MWQQIYTPVAGSLAWSAAAAAFPVAVALLALGVFRLPAWKASLWGLLSAAAVAFFAYHMPTGLLLQATAYGAAFGLFPIGWIVYTAILLYRITTDTGKFEIIKDSIAGITGDEPIQALYIAFAFGAFLEGACGFGTPVAVAAAMLAGLGFLPFRAASVCLLANTAPVAFGAIAIPLVTLAGITGLPLSTLSANVGRLCAPVSFILPSYLVLLLSGPAALKRVFPAALASGAAFAGTQFFVSNYVGAPLTDILSSVAAMAALTALLQFWRPGGEAPPVRHPHSSREVTMAWLPYILLVVFVLLWGFDSVKHRLGFGTFTFPWPGLHNRILRSAPVVPSPAPYAAVYVLNLLSAAGTACLFASLAAAVFLRVGPLRFLRLAAATARQLALPTLTMAAVLAIAFLMNYSGATGTLGLAFAATGVMFPFFSAFLGWLGVFLTGSDTSSNALFGSLQVVTATRLHLNPALMAAANSTGGVMGKMISLQSIAVAAAATGMPASDETRLFRFTLKHSLLLASITGALALFYAYVQPGWVR